MKQNKIKKLQKYFYFSQKWDPPKIKLVSILMCNMLMHSSVKSFESRIRCYCIKEQWNPSMYTVVMLNSIILPSYLQQVVLFVIIKRDHQEISKNFDLTYNSLEAIF